uniref:Uncharacterized protein n=1 Tax=Tanacetum cinerariifolium TaxID=118510 RepID=A0A699H6U1_TANCI|nr:hypothetical protein [Tanacetum cinerariifolium]
MGLFELILNYLSGTLHQLAEKEEGYYPLDFEGFSWGKEGEKRLCDLGGKHCAQHSILKGHREYLARCTAPSAYSSPPPFPSPLLPSSECLTQIQTLRMASTQALIDAVTAALPSPPLPPPLCIPPPIDRRDDTSKTEMPPRKRSCLFALGSRYEIGESSTARPTREAVPEIAPMTLGEVNTRVTDIAELHEHDTQDLYALPEDAQDRDSMDCRGGGLCFPRGLGLLDRIESDSPSGASDPPGLYVYTRDLDPGTSDIATAVGPIVQGVYGLEWGVVVGRVGSVKVAGREGL